MNNVVETQAERTDTGYRLGDLEILFGEGGKGRMLRANSLVMHGSRNIVVDPASSEQHHYELAKNNPILFFTHYHGDHRMSEHCYPEDSSVWVSALDAEAMENTELFATMIGAQDIAAAKLFAINLKQSMKLRDWIVERRMNDGDILEAGGCQAELIHLPGHTPGHMGLFFPEQSLLFITDIDLSPLGPWYGNVVSNMKDYKQSIERVRHFECDWYYTSHGEIIYDRKTFLEKLNVFDSHFERRDNIILDALSKGEKSIKELCDLEVVYRHSTLKKMPHLLAMERIHVKFHLEELIDQGIVESDEQFECFALT